MYTTNTWTEELKYLSVEADRYEAEHLCFSVTNVSVNIGSGMILMADLMQRNTQRQDKNSGSLNQVIRFLFSTKGSGRLTKLL